MIRPRLFLSYARADLAHAEHLFGVLTDQGCTVWMDRNELLVGDDFVTGLQSHLASSDAIVILLTQRSAESSWCLAELQYALGRGLVVIVVATRWRNPWLPFLVGMAIVWLGRL